MVAGNITGPVTEVVENRTRMKTSYRHHMKNRTDVPPMRLRLLSVTLAVLTATSVSVQATGRLCGKQLADALDLVCMGRGFHWDVNKRSGVPLLTKREEGGRGKRSVSQRGVVEECCVNVCSIEMLERYCAEPASDSMLTHLRQHFAHMTQSVEQTTTTLPPSPPTPGTPSTLSSELATNPRKFNSFFYLHVGPRPTRSPLI
ncbi:insulin-like growth factor I [Haliotis asinina]|uniref:insulin-like growth factor I n=1 Tax=Haliotis asinina TaxID=109174 RepID=UPI0035324B45